MDTKIVIKEEDPISDIALQNERELFSKDVAMKIISDDVLLDDNCDIPIKTEIKSETLSPGLCLQDKRDLTTFCVTANEMEKPTLKDVEEKLRSGELTLLKKEGCSPAWEKFSNVCKEATKTPIGFAQCIECGKVLNIRSGTTSMLRHVCKFDKSRTDEKNIVKSDKDLVAEKCVEMCSRDLRPFTSIEGEGFLNLGQTLINMGHKYGSVNIKEFIPSRVTVARKVQACAAKVRNKMLPEIIQAVRSKSCASATYLWTDSYRGMHYVCVTMHYIDSEWHLNKRVVMCSAFPDCSETGVNIRNDLEECLKDLGISQNEMHNITFITDQGSNIVKALDTYRRIPCMTHIINTILRHSLSESFLNENMPEVLSVIQSTKSIVAYFKRRDLCVRLKSPLKQYCSTQWNSNLDMLQSVQSQINDVKTILENEGTSHKMIGYNQDIAEQLITFLRPFKEATTDLEGDTEPTLHLVLPWFYALKNHCTPKKDDEKYLKLLKEAGGEFLQQKMDISMMHKVATFLVPNYRTLRKLDVNEKATVHEAVRQMCAEVQLPYMSCEDIACTSAESEMRQVKKRRFDDWEDEAPLVEDEVMRYLTAGQNTNDTILLWWKNNSHRFPRLANVAKKILNIPATSASSERVFSCAGNLIGEKRSNLCAQRLSDLIIIHENSKFSSSELGSR